MAILVQDTFNRADSTTLGTAETGQTWQKYGNAVFGVLNNQAYPSTSVSDSFYYVDSLSNNVKISVNNGALNAGENGIYFRIINATNYIRMIRSTGTIYLQKTINGTRTTVSSKAVTFTANEKQTVISKSDGTIEVYLNDVLQITSTVSDHLTATQHGFGYGSQNANARWDNFLVESLDTGTGTDGSTSFDIRQSLYSDGAVNGDTNQFLFADGAVNADLRQSLYSDSFAALDTKQAIYSDSATGYDTRLSFYSDASTLFDTLQEFFSDGIVGSTPFDIRMVLCADNAAVFDSKQAVYSDGSVNSDLTQQFYQAGANSADLKLVIYADASPKFDASQTIYSDASVKADTAQRFYTDGTLDFDMLQAILEDWNVYNEVIQIVLNVTQSKSVTLGITQRQQTELKM